MTSCEKNQMYFVVRVYPFCSLSLVPLSFTHQNIQTTLWEEGGPLEAKGEKDSRLPAISTLTLKALNVMLIQYILKVNMEALKWSRPLCNTKGHHIPNQGVGSVITFIRQTDTTRQANNSTEIVYQTWILFDY
jgi:hypothetical protein